MAFKKVEPRTGARDLSKETVTVEMSLKELSLLTALVARSGIADAKQMVWHTGSIREETKEVVTENGFKDFMVELSKDMQEVAETEGL